MMTLRRCCNANCMHLVATLTVSRSVVRLIAHSVYRPKICDSRHHVIVVNSLRVLFD